MFIVAVQSKFLLGSASPWDRRSPSQWSTTWYKSVLHVLIFFNVFRITPEEFPGPGCPRRRIIFGLVWGYTIWANCSGDSFLICCYSLLLGILPWVDPTMITQGFVVAVLICGGKIREFLPGCWEPAMTLSNTTVFVVIIVLLNLSHELKEMDGSRVQESLCRSINKWLRVFRATSLDQLRSIDENEDLMNECN